MGQMEIHIEKVPVEVVKKKLREMDQVFVTAVNSVTADEDGREPSLRLRATNHVRGNAVNEDLKKRLRALCEEAGAEQDSERLLQLVREIDRLLAADKEKGDKDATVARGLEQAG